MNSPNNYNTFSLTIYKILYCLLISCVSSFVFSQNEEVDPDGYNVFYYSNGKIASEGYFVKGLPNGVWKSYYQNGQLKSIGNKKEGLSDSLWKFYDIDGTLTWKYSYKNDKKNGCATKYDTLGIMEQETYYVDDIKQGEEIWYYVDGSIKKKIEFIDDKENGLALEYNHQGQVISEEEYSKGYLRKKENFNQLNEKGEKVGTWRTYHSNGKVATEINYENGKKEGIATSYDAQGKLININSMKGDTVASDPGGIVMIDLYKEYHDNGKVKLVGGTNKGLKSGIFREYDADGNLIQGYIYNKDTLMSEGMVQAGGIFVGEWKTYYKNGKIKSTGPYQNGQKDGFWTYYYENGKKEQEGKFKNDVLSGQWNWYYENSQLKKQEFFNNKGLLEGPMTEYDSLGVELARGEYYNGKKEGAWFYQVGDYKEVGSFTLDRPNGIWQYFYQNGKLAFVGEFSEGEPRGKHTYYHKNGLKKLVGKHAGGLRHGTWKEFDERGELVEIIQYRNGEIYRLNGFRVVEIEEEK